MQTQITNYSAQFGKDIWILAMNFRTPQWKPCTWLHISSSLFIHYSDSPFNKQLKQASNHQVSSKFEAVKCWCELAGERKREWLELSSTIITVWPEVYSHFIPSIQSCFLSRLIPDVGFTHLATLSTVLKLCLTIKYLLEILMLYFTIFGRCYIHLTW